MAANNWRRPVEQLKANIEFEIGVILETEQIRSFCTELDH